MIALLLLGNLSLAEEADRVTLSEGTWMNVDLHRRTLVFDLLGDIWRLPMNGGDAEPLTAGPDWDRQPRFSPNGRSVAYVSDRSGRDQIWVMDRSGGSPRPLTSLTDAQARDPAWLPDGSGIIYRRVETDGRSALWRQPLDDQSPPLQLTDPDRHHLAGEPTVSDQGLWFSTRTTPYVPDGDPVAGLWQIMWTDLSGGPIRPVLSGAGSAARPTLSPDGRRLAFISRDRGQTMLEVIDLTNGIRTIVADWLSRDQLEGAATAGTYPAFDWASDSRSLVLWARGGLWSVSLSGFQEAIPFTVTGAWPTAQDRPTEQAQPDTISARAIGGMAWGPEEQLAFTAMGALWLRQPDGALTRLADNTGDLPAWRTDGNAVAWTAGPGTDSGALGVRTFGWRAQVSNLPLAGNLLHPAWSEDSRRLTVLRQIDAHDSERWYEVLMLTRRIGRWSLRRVTTLDGYGAHSTPPIILAREGRLWFPTDDDDGTVFMSIKDDGTDPQIHLRLSGAESIVASPDLSKLAYRVGSDLFVTELPRTGELVEVETLNRMRAPGGVSQHMAWLADSSGLSWFEGSDLHIHHFSETDATIFEGATPAAPRTGGDGVMALTNARALTMARDGEIIDNATIVIEDSRIVSVAANTAPPPGAEVIDCNGMTVIPGLIDIQAYAHEDKGAARPASEWRYRAALDFGVTTIHDTTTQTTAALPQAERAAIGLQVGPRVLATGTPVYGAQSSEEARLHVQRSKASGAHSIKLDRRATRSQQRWYATACQLEDISCVATAADVAHAMTLLMDGYHIVEGAIPYTPIHADILTLWARSETTIVPALLATSDGLRGENYFFQQYSFVLEDPRLNKHYPRRMLDQTLLRGRVLARDWDWSFQARARDVETLRREGAHVALGSAGRLQGLGLHWEMWALSSSGAMPPYAVLQTATIHNARSLGLRSELGSIEAGKRADLVVLTADPLESIQNSVQIALVIHNGLVYE